jgi:hypothetical protein
MTTCACSSNAVLGEPPQHPAPGSVWKHRKGGKYTVAFVAREEKTKALVVVYWSMSHPWLVWTLPIEEFLDGRFEELPAEHRKWGVYVGHPL